MAHVARDRSLDQRQRVHRIVAVIAEGIANRVGHNDRSGEMDDSVDPMLRDQCCYARLVPRLADDKRHILRHSPLETGRQIVEHHHAFAGIDERVDHMASDIAGTASD